MSRWALITGARRLGAHVARRAAQGGWNIVLHYHEAGEEAADLVRELETAFGVCARSVETDLSTPENAHALMAQARAGAGAPITALFNCAAIFEHDVADNVSADALMRHFAINAAAPILLTHAFAAQLEGAQGVVVNFLDYKLKQPYQDHFSYTISKFALAGATEMLARALAPGVRVNAVAPAYALPSPGQSQADFERQHAKTPLGYGVTGEDVAEAAIYLAEARAVTGQVLYVDAGQRFIARDRDFAFS